MMNINKNPEVMYTELQQKAIQVAEKDLKDAMQWIHSDEDMIDCAEFTYANSNAPFMKWRWLPNMVFGIEFYFED